MSAEMSEERIRELMSVPGSLPYGEWVGLCKALLASRREREEYSKALERERVRLEYYENTLVLEGPIALPLRGMDPGSVEAGTVGAVTLKMLCAQRDEAYERVARYQTERDAARSESLALRAERDEEAALFDRMRDLLTRTANALKGEPDELNLHDWSDLPDVAREARAALASARGAAIEECAIAVRRYCEDTFGWEETADMIEKQIRALAARTAGL